MVGPKSVLTGGLHYFAPPTEANTLSPGIFITVSSCFHQDCNRVLLGMKVFCALKVASGALCKQGFIKPSYKKSNPAVVPSNRDVPQRGRHHTRLFPCGEGYYSRRGLLSIQITFAVRSLG